MKLLNKLITFLLVFFLFFSSALPTLAQETINPCPQGTLSAVCDESFSVNSLVQNILSYLFVIGAIIAVIFLVWGGIKWITSGGDKAKVEEARSTIIGAIIGLVVVFASYLLIALVLRVVFDINLSNLNLPSLTGGGGGNLPPDCTEQMRNGGFC